MAFPTLEPSAAAALRRGTVIPAHPLALAEDGSLDERRQRGLTRYYAAAGAGGVAVGVHTTQFEIHDPSVGLYRPVLALAAETVREEERTRNVRILRVAGICGQTAQAAAEAETAAGLGYDAGLLSLAAMRTAGTAELIAHCRAVAGAIPLFGFYLQPDAGGRVLDYAFWREFFDIPNVAAVKMAPFNRYRTLDVVRALADSGREGEIALYTGNDDNIVADLTTPFRCGGKTLRIVGGLLGHWSFWTKRAVELLEETRRAAAGPAVPADLLARGVETTDANAAVFDAANAFRGCIAGINEVLRRQGLLASARCISPREVLSPGQAEEISRVARAYPHLTDDAFVAERRDGWLR